MGNNPSRFKEVKNPVEKVSWKDCQEFCKKTWLSLPTEAQWEYACGGGSGGKYCFGDDKSKLGEYAWYKENSGAKTHPVGEKKPNAYGLYDMHGNVYEWCEDWHGDYPKKTLKNPKGPLRGSYRLLRGGSYYYNANICKSSFRFKDLPANTTNVGIGLRCVSSF